MPTIYFNIWCTTLETEAAGVVPWHYQTTQWERYVEILRQLETGEDERGALVTNVEVEAWS